MARVFGISTNICSSVLSRHREELPVFCSKIETLFFKSKSIQLPSPVSPAFNFQTVQIPSSNIILTWSTWSTWSTSSRWCATMLLDVSKYFLPATFSLVPAINFQAGKWVTWVSQPRVFGITKKPLVSLDQLCLLLCVCGCPKLKAHWARQRNPYFTHISKRHGWRWHEKGSSVAFDVRFLWGKSLSKLSYYDYGDQFISWVGVKLVELGGSWGLHGSNTICFSHVVFTNDGPMFKRP